MIKNLFQNHKKQFIIIFIALAVVMMIVVIVFLGFFKKGNNSNFPFAGIQGGTQGSVQGGMRGGRGGYTMSENMVAASGVTSVGITEESFDVENLVTALEIEEVYTSSNEEVEAGTKILKLSEESIREAREELEETLQDAGLAYRAGTIEYEQSKITAEYDRDSGILDGEYAQEIYDETVSGLEDEVEKAEEELADAKEQIAEYESYVNNGTYREHFKVDEYQKTYDETLELLEEKMEEWGISWSQVTSGGGQGGMGGNSRMPESVSGGDAQTGAGNDQIQVLSSLYGVLERNREDLDQAESDYEDAIANAAFELQTLQLRLPSLEQAVTEAKQNYETQILQAKLTYETTLAGAESADSDYETNIQKAESDYDTLKSDWEDAKENLELFEERVGDGYFYASEAGTILRMMVRAEQDLVSEAIVFVYSNPEEMTVTVSVDQSDIAKIALGDKATIQSTEYGIFEGEVTQINPVSTSESRTSVTYDVTVKVTGEIGELSANESVTVIFGMEELPNDDEAQMPAGGERPQMPSGEGASQMPAGGERPQMPSDGEASQPPVGGENSQRPSGGGASQPPVGGENSQRPSGEGASQMPAGGESSQGSSDSEALQMPAGQEMQRPEGRMNGAE